MELRTITNAEELVEITGGQTGTSKGFCPAHDDGEKPSLSISNSEEDDKILVYCWGGCSQKTVIAGLAEKHGAPGS